MDKFCSNCGTERKNESNFCPNCGKSLNIPNTIKEPGKGKTIASMVLGIIAVTWAFLSILSLEDIEYEVYALKSIAELVGFFIGYNLFSLPTGIIGLILGASSKIKNGMKIAGIITSSIAVGIILINLIVMIGYYY